MKLMSMEGCLKFAHIPLIHSTSGKKLSKRDNASTLSVTILKLVVLTRSIKELSYLDV